MRDDFLIKGRHQMATIFGVTDTGFKSMEQRGLPIHTRERAGALYHLPTVWKWREADLERQASTRRGPVSPGQVTTAKGRKQEAEARRAEIEVAQLEGTLVDAALTGRLLEGLMIHCRTIAVSIPSLIGRDIDDPGVRIQAVAVADRRLREMLEAMAQYEFSTTDANDLDGDESPQSPAPDAKDDSQPVGRGKKIPKQRRRGKRSLE